MIILKFFVSIILYETQILKKRYEYLKYIFQNLNLIDYINYSYSKKKINPIKCKKFKNFLFLNKKKWKRINNENIKIKNNKIILIDNFINQAQCSLNNISIGKYLSYFHNSECNGLLNKGDIKGEELFRSFGIKNFYYFDDKNFFVRSYYVFKALRILSNISNTNDLCKLKINNIDIGLTTYDTFIRYSRIPTSNKIKFKMIVLLAQALLANDFFFKFV